MTFVLNALVNGMIVGLGLVAVVRAALWLIPARLLNAATRYAIWWAVMVAIALLPLAYVPLGSGRGAVTKPIGFVPPPSLARVQTPASPTPSIGFVPPSSVVSTPVQVRVGSRPLFPVVIAAGPWASRIVFVWIALALLMFARRVASVVMLERRKARASEVPGLLAGRIFAALRSRRNVRVKCSSGIPIPMAAGPWRPSILLPSQLLEALSEQELEQIGIHEAGHFARYDDYALLVQRVLETLLVLNPVVWSVSRQIDLEREIACDDLVVAATGDAQPYAACLARVVELSGAVRGMPMAAAAAEDRSHLAKRVAMLLDRTQNQGTRLGGLRLALAVVCVAALSWSAVQNRGLVAFASAPAQMATVLVPQALMLAQAGQSATPSNSTPGANAGQDSASDGPQNDQMAGILQREKEIIAETLREKTTDSRQALEMAERLAREQAALHDSLLAHSLNLMQRALTGETHGVSEIETDTRAAMDTMIPAVQELREQRWEDAARDERTALQGLLRADASERQGAAPGEATTVDPEDRQREINFVRRQLDALAHKLQDLSGQMGKATPADLDEEAQGAQLAEQLLKHLEDRLREIDVAQADGRSLPFFGGVTSASVYIPAEVLDPMGRFVTGLDQGAFHVHEDGVEQHISDVLGTEEPPDIFIVADSRYPTGVDFSKMKGYATVYQTEEGKVLDTVRTMNQLGRTHRIGRKIAIIVAGSAENAPKYTEAELRSMLAGLAMPAFVFVVPESGVASGQAGILNEIASRSGGRYIPVASASDLAAAINPVVIEAANLYFLGYIPSNAAHDGSYRNVQVTVQAPRGLPALSVRGASGYVAASQ